MNRCPWVNLKNPLYIKYHDKEWGRPIRTDRKHFEFLTLEGAQAGLSWETILQKRAHYKKVFHNFDVDRVSRMTRRDITRLLKDPGIIRNRLKVESTISNAKAFMAIQKKFGSFNKYIWGFVEGKSIQNNFSRLKDYPSSTPLSNAISKDLKKRGFRFVGPTIVYAYMQAAGLTNDHTKNCFCHPSRSKP